MTDTMPADHVQRRLAGQRMTSSYSKLSRRVREQGLLRRARGSYGLVFGGLFAALAVAITGMVLLGQSWLQLLIAGALGIILTQLAFLSHEAAHRQIFATNRTNDRFGRLVGTGLVGISYSWWMTKHSRHHANPNRIGKDPDIEGEALAFYEEKARPLTGIRAAIARRQGYLFFPMLTLEGLNLHYTSVKSLLRRGRVDGRWLELGLLAARFAAYLTVVFWLLPVGMAFAFIGVQVAVFGLYMGATFAPNHKGMPIVDRDAKLDFLSRQVLTSRNIAGRIWPTVLMGGLNYQVEHHLFPSMPRFHLARARRLVIQHCREQGVPYTEVSLGRSYAAVIEYLNRVGLAARDPFDCPVAGQLGRD